MKVFVSLFVLSLIPSFATADETLDGQVLLSELNCVSCHSAENHQMPLAVKQAPRLGDVGQRITPNYLRRFLKDPQGVKAATTMPDLLHGLSPSKKQKDEPKFSHWKKYIYVTTISKLQYR